MFSRRKTQWTALFYSQFKLFQAWDKRSKFIIIIIIIIIIICNNMCDVLIC